MNKKLFVACFGDEHYNTVPLVLQLVWLQAITFVIHPDATTAATPLAIMKGVINGAPGMSLSDLPASFDLLIGNNGGCLGEVSALALL